MSSPETPPLFEPHFPREMVLASAGTGKTYTLSSRLIGLLTLGAGPEHLLASTFTRKAAGEILQRVLERLAAASLDEAAARELEASAGPRMMVPGHQVSAQARYGQILGALAKEIHRVDIGTLDSLFVRIARSFAGDLEMPPDWEICDEPTARRLEAEALQRVLSAAAPDGMVELVRMTMKGEAGRAVHRRLLGQMEELRGLFHQRGAENPETFWATPDPSPYALFLEDQGNPDWEVVVQALRDAPLPTTGRGEPDRRFLGALEAGIEALLGQDWSGFCGKGLGGKVLAGEDEFYGKALGIDLTDAVKLALGKVSVALRGELSRQIMALRTLGEGYDAALAELQRQEGRYRFNDITSLLTGAEPIVARGDLWYRLDQRARHLLLDEFQDTSRVQWEALYPLTSEFLAGDPEDRSVLVVADPKQSIYGWRGAEPSLARQVATDFGLSSRTLSASYRSSTAVLDLVNLVFSEIADSGIWEMEPTLLPAVQEWAQAFTPHVQAQKIAGQPGVASVEVGPREEGRRGSDRPLFLSWAAGRIGEIHRSAPGAKLGILVRRNAAVARLTAELRRLGVEASEEGASTLTDSAAVSTFLSLMRLADHPGDDLARFQVARSPLGPFVGLTEPADPVMGRRVALDLRRKLLSEGYGQVMAGLIDQVDEIGAFTSRDRDRVSQLLELAYRWEGRTTLRPSDFVRFVQEEAVESPSDARVRVMTVHKAKGLEFDVVVLPELDLRLTKGGGFLQAVLPLRHGNTGGVTRIFPRLSRDLLPLFPDVEAASRQDRERALVDALGVVYVALTRARHSLHLLLEADPPEGPKIEFSPAGLIRTALGLDSAPLEAGGKTIVSGSEDWVEELPRMKTPWVAARQGSLKPSPPRQPQPGDGGRTRLLPHRTPSSLGGHGAHDLSRLFALGTSEGRRVGTIIHAWLETLVWIEDWAPDLALFQSIGSRVAPGLSLEETERLLHRLMNGLEAPEVKSLLTRESYPPGSEVLNEEPFVVRLPDGLYQGRIDRMVLIRQGGEITGAEVLDFKTDGIDLGQPGALDRAAAQYRDQLRVYGEATAQLLSLPTEAIRTKLVFLDPGRIVTSGRS